MTTDRQRRETYTLAAGWLILALAAGALFLPLLEGRRGAMLIGALLIAAGLVEMAGTARRGGKRPFALAAGLVTALVGLLFIGRPATSFIPALYLIAAWLAARCLLLLGAALQAQRPSPRRWTGIAAITDALLALLVLTGVSIATLVTTLFGATPDLVASFAWVLAASFAATGLMLLELAVCEEEEAA